MANTFPDKFYGRRKGRPLNQEREDALDLLEQIGVNEELLTQAGTASPGSLFSKDFDGYWLEIGFGNGEFLSKAQPANPEIGYIGAEPYINGVAALLKSIQNHKTVQNIRVWPDDVRPLLKSLAPASIDRVLVLNPDPWPKKRHHKRRIINPDTLDHLSRILKPDGDILMTTDVDDLAEWMITQIVNHSDFRWKACAPADALTPPDGWEPTRYEIKGRQAGRKQYYLNAIKKL